ncbi:hypothetical protein [Streptomyces clavuligerus]|nr:hypothetical protein [Streptomyces clavuligerus]
MDRVDPRLVDRAETALRSVEGVGTPDRSGCAGSATGSGRADGESSSTPG